MLQQISASVGQTTPYRQTVVEMTPAAEIEKEEMGNEDTNALRWRGADKTSPNLLTSRRYTFMDESFF